MKRKAVAVLVNDIHLDKGNGELIKDIFLNQLINLCLSKKIDNIFIGGDIFTNRSGQPLTCLTVWKEILEGVKEKGIRIHVIPGSHDKTDADDERSYLDIYSGQFLYRNAVCRNFDGLDVIFIPYFKDEKWLEEFQRVDCKRDKDNPAILITHMGFDGVRNNDGGLVQSSIKPSMFKDYAKVLIGHYHDASKLGSNVFYTGSAYQNNYGENIISFKENQSMFVNIKDSEFEKYVSYILDTENSKLICINGNNKVVYNLLEESNAIVLSREYNETYESGRVNYEDLDLGERGIMYTKINYNTTKNIKLKRIN